MERNMQRCSNDCGFLVHPTDHSMGSYCCKRCHQCPNQHGDRCQRKRAGPDSVLGCIEAPDQPLSKKGAKTTARTSADVVSSAGSAAALVSAYRLRRNGGRVWFIVICEDEKALCCRNANDLAHQICSAWTSILEGRTCTWDSSKDSGDNCPSELLRCIHEADKGRGSHFKWSYFDGQAAVGVGSNQKKRERAWYLALAMAKSVTRVQEHLHDETPPITDLQRAGMDAESVDSAGPGVGYTGSTTAAGGGSKLDTPSSIASFLDSIDKDFGKAFGMEEILIRKCGFSTEEDLLEAVHDDFKPLLEHKEIPPFTLNKLGRTLASRRRGRDNPLRSQDIERSACKDTRGVEAEEEVGGDWFGEKSSIYDRDYRNTEDGEQHCGGFNKKYGEKAGWNSSNSWEYCDDDDDDSFCDSQSCNEGNAKGAVREKWKHSTTWEDDGAYRSRLRGQSSEHEGSSKPTEAKCWYDDDDTNHSSWDGRSCNEGYAEGVGTSGWYDRGWDSNDDDNRHTWHDQDQDDDVDRDGQDQDDDVDSSGHDEESKSDDPHDEAGEQDVAVDNHADGQNAAAVDDAEDFEKCREAAQQQFSNKRPRLEPTPKSCPSPSTNQLQQAASSASSAVQYLMQRPLKRIQMNFRANDDFEITADFDCPQGQQETLELTGLPEPNIKLLGPRPPSMPPPGRLLALRPPTPPTLPRPGASDADAMGEIEIVDVDDVYHSQESCSEEIRSPDGRVPLRDLLNELITGQCHPFDDFLLLEAVRINSDPPKYVCTDNRRLACLKDYKECSGLDVKIRLSIRGEMKSLNDYRRAYANSDKNARHHEIRRRRRNPMSSDARW
eukprot:TRINITY_DN30156_c0_g2_i1.p1 TRINITY_DN30156_c0_g2~~TRINITY_DN30156_c0_g2_i1.p1  ORF type:complete len:833 (-),score=169.07 TRINITY_DN30156_c0_g2_i1:549-3047(-)